MDVLVRLDGLAFSLLFVEFVVLTFVGFPPFFIFTALFVSLLLYSKFDDLTLSFVVRHLVHLIPRIFFREIQIRGQHKLPPPTDRSHAILFVAAPHANQFIDPLLLFQITDRPISFLTAAKSLRRKEISAFANAMGAIGVERPQDIAKVGKGKIVKVEGNKVVGEDTEFTSELKAGYTMYVKGEALVVSSVESNREATLSAPAEVTVKGDNGRGEGGVTFKVAPKVNQDGVYNAVWDALGRGQYVGLFPEGGSTDLSHMLPLKVGAAIFALGALAQHSPNLTLSIFPVGLNYFSGHRFRSRVYIDIGDPIIPSNEAVEKYRKGGNDKKEACNALLDEIRRSLESITTAAPDHDTLQLIWAVRRLYKPYGMKLTTAAKLELTRRFEESRVKLGDRKEVKELMEDVRNYNENLSLYGLKDHQIEHLQPSMSIFQYKSLSVLIQRVVLLFLLSIAALPGTLLNLPIILATRYISSKKAIQAKKESSVKLTGKDVIATWKILVSLGLLPLCFIIYPTLSAVVGHYCGLGALYCWSYFALFQVPAMYGAVRFLETGREILLSLRPLAVLVVAQMKSIAHRVHSLPSTSSSSASSSSQDPLDEIVALKNQREDLSKKIRTMVDQLGPQLFGPQFNDWRLIKPHQGEEEKKKQSEGNKLNLKAAIPSISNVVELGADVPVFENKGSSKSVPTESISTATPTSPSLSLPNVRSTTPESSSRPLSSRGDNDYTFVSKEGEVQGGNGNGNGGGNGGNVSLSSSGSN